MSDDNSISANSSADNANNAKSTRKLTPLPPYLAGLTKDDLDKFVIVDETVVEDGKEKQVPMALAVVVDGMTYPLKHVTQDHLRMLCKNIEVPKYGRAKKQKMCQHIGAKCRFKELNLTSHANFGVAKAKTRTRSIVRFVNALFHPDFVPTLLKINDLKRRSDHELKTTPRNIWDGFADEYNDRDNEDFTKFLSNVDADLRGHLKEEEVYQDIDLKNFTAISDGKSARLLAMKLFKIRQIMQENMTKSGTHESDPMMFVDQAIKKAKGVSGVGKWEMYYFFVRCEEHKELDNTFQEDMDDSLKSSSTDTTHEKPASASRSSSKRIENAINETVKEYQESKELIKEQNAEQKMHNAMMREEAKRSRREAKRLREEMKRKNNFKMYSFLLSDPNTSKKMKKRARRAIEASLNSPASTASVNSPASTASVYSPASISSLNSPASTACETRSQTPK